MDTKVGLAEAILACQLCPHYEWWLTVLFPKMQPSTHHTDNRFESI